MSEQDEPTVVIFRRWRPQYGEGVIAVFPEIDAGSGTVMCYEHVGQHGGGHYYEVIRGTRATRYDDSDVMALKAELEQRGYVLAPRQRANWKTMRSKQ